MMYNLGKGKGNIRGKKNKRGGKVLRPCCILYNTNNQHYTKSNVTWLKRYRVEK